MGLMGVLMSFNTYTEFLEEHADEITVISLKDYYNTCKEEKDTELLSAIDRVLQDFMTYSDYLIWKRDRD